jgi:hypothetical protein
MSKREGNTPGKKQVCMDKKKYDSLNKANRLKTLYKTLAIIFIVSTIGVSAFFIGYTLNPPTFQLTMTFDDFYVQDADTLEKNYSYYLNGFQMEGISLLDNDWNNIKDMNSTAFMMYAIGNIIYIKQSLFGLYNINQSLKADNHSFVSREIPNIIITDFRQVDVFNDDGTMFKSDLTYSLLFDIFITSATMLFDEYPYKSNTSKQDISIKILGIDFNFTSWESYNLFLEYNGIPLQVSYS